MSAETNTQPKAEQEAKHERLSKEEVDKAFADIAFILTMESTIAEDDPIWEQLAALQEALFGVQKPAEDTPASPAPEALGMLDYSLRRDHDGYKRWPKLPPTRAWEPFGAGVKPNFNPDYVGSSAGGGSHTAASEPNSDFTPAPGMADKPLGPDLPNLAFNDRVRPTQQRPTESQFAAADRANEMYQRALWDKGWRGGEATPDQAKKAGRAMQFENHPDRGASQENVDALTAFNSHNAKPTTPGQKASESAPPASAPAESARSAGANAGPSATV